MEKHVGAGAFAKVYSAKPLAVDLDVDDNDDCNNLALKVRSTKGSVLLSSQSVIKPSFTNEY